MKQGIYPSMSMADYLALPALSSGVAHTLIAATPLHARFEQQNERTASKEMDIGTLAHACLLEGGTDNVRVFDPAAFPNAKGGGVATGWTNKAIREARDAARLAGEIPMLKADYDDVRAMVNVALEYIAASSISDLFDTGLPEQTLIWDDEGVLCKARPDWLSDSILCHYKTTTTVNPRAFSRQVANMGYDFALMFYMRGLSAVKPDADVNHVIFAQEAKKPYACKLFDLTPARAAVAELSVTRAIVQWGRCQRENQWPAYSGDVHSIDLTPWELAQAEEDMLTDDELSGGIPA